MPLASQPRRTRTPEELRERTIMALTAEERRLKQREYNKRWSEAHPEARREYKKRWQKENAEHLREYNREYSRKGGAFLYLRRAWTLDEDLMVLEHSMTYTELGKILHRSMDSVKGRSKRLNTMFKAHMV